MKRSNCCSKKVFYLPPNSMLGVLTNLRRIDAAYIVDDAAAHEDNLKSMMDADKAVFLATREEAMDADALTRQAAVDAKKAQYARDHNLPFSSTSTSELIRFHTIPTASSPSLYRSENKNCEIVPRPNEAAYEIYRFLQGKGYYLSPGLRFGCMFMAYPGDPLRFHSHFLVNGYGWEEGVPLVDLVAGGRLGTGVKKAWMFGGRKPDFGDKEGEVRSFCVEWGGF